MGFSSKLTKNIEPIDNFKIKLMVSRSGFQTSALVVSVKPTYNILVIFKNSLLLKLSNNHVMVPLFYYPGLNFGTLMRGAHSRDALFRAEALIRVNMVCLYIEIKNKIKLVTIYFRIL